VGEIMNIDRTDRTQDDARDRDRLLRQAELIISNVLRGGVLLSAGVIIVGVIAFYGEYITHGAEASLTTFPHTLRGVAAGLAQGDPLAIIVLGLLLLLATPLVRVLVSIIAFAIEGDRLYVIITSIVLLILLISFLSGRGGA
jgi:uncharacterized membrane protein